jgi:hypothetical protein
MNAEEREAPFQNTLAQAPRPDSVWVFGWCRRGWLLRPFLRPAPFRATAQTPT